MHRWCRLNHLPTLYQQNDINIRYKGAGWKTVTNANASLGNYKNTLLSTGTCHTFSQVKNAERFAALYFPRCIWRHDAGLHHPLPAGGIACPDVSNNRTDYFQPSPSGSSSSCSRA